MKVFRIGIPRLGGGSECVFQVLEASNAQNQASY